MNVWLLKVINKCVFSWVTSSFCFQSNLILENSYGLLIFFKKYLLLLNNYINWEIFYFHSFFLKLLESVYIAFLMPCIYHAVFYKDASLDF